MSKELNLAFDIINLSLNLSIFSTIIHGIPTVVPPSAGDSLGMTSAFVFSVLLCFCAFVSNFSL